MNAAFREAAAQARQKPVKLTHNQEVRKCQTCTVWAGIEGEKSVGRLCRRWRGDVTVGVGREVDGGLRSAAMLPVARLYRKALKTLSSWIIDREIFLEEATNLRGRFDAERGVSNAKAVRMLKSAGGGEWTGDFGEENSGRIIYLLHLGDGECGFRIGGSSRFNGECRRACNWGRQTREAW
ncbi:predicted protein [Thalassiosira pseudonana CCMP1335]|uniref:NADH dehydrogenase [ubiquinone] 1 beta subcomplex subunit 9 n=1 Tax=Thalassiosira pseudonana TaxID=35128 RepID=B5YP97_THAPS|nr:predicted protein [Thalassiosira pseudonana CCMP1335]ACI64762.1 predicted protein [Thalassiosira pseudonana CCMP1335]